jgi:hypothetical protein
LLGRRRFIAAAASEEGKSREERRRDDSNKQCVLFPRDGLRLTLTRQCVGVKRP